MLRMAPKRTLTENERKILQRRGRSKFRFQWRAACEKVVREIQENPPRVTLWLKGKVDLPRALRIKEQIEKDDPLDPGEVAKAKVNLEDR
jgi:hypothetical protein